MCFSETNIHIYVWFVSYFFKAIIMDIMIKKPPLNVAGFEYWLCPICYVILDK